MAPIVKTRACIPMVCKLLMILLLVPTPIPKRKSKRKIEKDVRMLTSLIILGWLPMKRPIPIPKTIMEMIMMISVSIVKAFKLQVMKFDESKLCFSFRIENIERLCLSVAQ